MVKLTAKSVFRTIVTTSGLLDNEYARQIQNVIVLDRLFD